MISIEHSMKDDQRSFFFLDMLYLYKQPSTNTQHNRCKKNKH
uniref:Uncharacterized protein n=1 Tax=Arundo donax TaxID=35708 RepID=A0A0A8ZM27_ARUDO